MVDLVWSTNTYHLIDLGRIRRLEAFTNHYRHEQGLGIDLGVGHSVVGWASVAIVMQG